MLILSFYEADVKGVKLKPIVLPLNRGIQNKKYIFADYIIVYSRNIKGLYYKYDSTTTISYDPDHSDVYQPY